jgi:hypothetical protein
MLQGGASAESDSVLPRAPQDLPEPEQVLLPHSSSLLSLQCLPSIEMLLGEAEET